MNAPIDLGNGKTISAVPAGSMVQLHMTKGFLAFSERITPRQAAEIAELLLQAARAALGVGVRCHNADACKAGQVACPTPKACGIGG